MNSDIDSIIEHHQIELENMKEELCMLTRKVSCLDETVSSLQSLKYDMFISYEISKMNFYEERHIYHLYEGINNAYENLKIQFEKFILKQYDTECVYKLNNHDFF